MRRPLATRQLLEPLRIPCEQSKEICHGYAHLLLAGFVLLKGPGSAAQKLARFALREVEARSNRRDFLRAEDTFNFGTKGEKSFLTLAKGGALEHGFPTGLAPVALHANLCGAPLVFDRV